MPRNTAIQAALSVPRFDTYLAATTPIPPASAPLRSQCLQNAVSLYGWNAAVSAVFMHPLHICEVAVRNAVSDALTAIHGSNWPWDNGFRYSLPLRIGKFSPRNEIIKVTAKVSQGGNPSTGKVVAEMKFAFWEFMFTQRHDQTLWKSQLSKVFPHAPAVASYFEVRAKIHSHLVKIRALRNRIAHHEPIFKRDLHDDLANIEEIISFRCPHTTEWLRHGQMVRFMLGHRPI